MCKQCPRARVLDDFEQFFLFTTPLVVSDLWSDPRPHPISFNPICNLACRSIFLICLSFCLIVMHSLQEMMPILEASLPDNRSKHDSPSIEAQVRKQARAEASTFSGLWIFDRKGKIQSQPTIVRDCSCGMFHQTLKISITLMVVPFF